MTNNLQAIQNTQSSPSVAGKTSRHHTKSHDHDDLFALACSQEKMIQRWSYSISRNMCQAQLCVYELQPDIHNESRILSLHSSLQTVLFEQTVQRLMLSWRTHTLKITARKCSKIYTRTVTRGASIFGCKDSPFSLC